MNNAFSAKAVDSHVAKAGIDSNRTPKTLTYRRTVNGLSTCESVLIISPSVAKKAAPTRATKAGHKYATSKLRKAPREVITIAAPQQHRIIPGQCWALIRSRSTTLTWAAVFLKIPHPEYIGKLPALKSTEDLWDWRLWAKQMGLKEETIRITHEFDLDDTAIRAACAGLGMVLAPRLTTQSEIKAGTLVALPGFEAIEMGKILLAAWPPRRRNSGGVSEAGFWK